MPTVKRIVPIQSAAVSYIKRNFLSLNCILLWFIFGPPISFWFVQFRCSEKVSIYSHNGHTHTAVVIIYIHTGNKLCSNGLQFPCVHVVQTDELTSPIVQKGFDSRRKKSSYHQMKSRSIDIVVWGSTFTCHLRCVMNQCILLLAWFHDHL